MEISDGVDGSHMQAVYMEVYFEEYLHSFLPFFWATDNVMIQ